MNLFDMDKPAFSFKPYKEIRLIELFAGMGCQMQALKRVIGNKAVNYKTSEWATESILAYSALHHGISPIPEREGDLTEWAYEKGLSLDWNKPATMAQLKRKDAKEPFYFSNVRRAYEAMHNMGGVQLVKGADLKIKDDGNCYVLTYSFPCQDISIAGKMEGFEEGSGTRSSLLWEAGRVLTEAPIKPQVLIMENVVGVNQGDYQKNFQKWLLILEKMGYKSLAMDLNAMDFGLAQKRARCFCVLILGDYHYEPVLRKTNPKPLKDFLEEDPPERYYYKKAVEIY